MGFYFNLFCLFFFLPLTGIFLLAWLISWDKTVGIVLGIIWLVIAGLVLALVIMHWATAKKVLNKEDYCGEYIVDREFFSGRQADWQYENFRFEITENDSIFFHVTNREKVLKTYRGSITVSPADGSKRLIVDMKGPVHHILTTNPTTYRSAWSFYLVLASPKFNNVFFKKGKWKPIDH